MTSTATCASCGAPSNGRYCSSCGEQRLDPHELTLGYFVTHTLVPEIFDLDAKIWRTLRLLLLHPAFLAIEYSAGRRKAYVKPLRVLLTAIIVYALSTQGGIGFTLGLPRTEIKLSTVPAPFPAGKSIDGTLFQIDRLDILRGMYEKKLGPVERAPADAQRRFSGMLNAVATALSLVSVVLLGLALYACFHRRRPLLVEHVVFSMHYSSFVLISLLPLVPLLRLRLLPALLALLFLGGSLLWQISYLAVAIRRFYLPDDGSVVAWPAAATLALLLYVLSSFFITVVQFTAGTVAIWSI